MTHPSYPKNSAPHPVLLPTPLIKSEQLSTAKVKAPSLLEWVGKRRRGSLHIPCGRRQSQIHIPGKSGWSEFLLKYRLACHQTRLCNLPKLPHLGKTGIPSN